MIRSRNLLTVAAIVILITIVFYQSMTGSSDPSPSTDKTGPVKVLTHMDSLIIKYDSLLTALIDSNETVGAAVVITHRGEIVHLKCYGVKRAGWNDPVDENTIFRLASVSKPVTGVLAGILDDEHIISLDDKVIEYLPGFTLKDSVNTFDLTVRHILSHTSGLVPHAYDNLVEAQIPFKTIIDSLSRVNISSVPGRLYGYQNVIFSLYDTISEVRTGRKFEDLLKEKVFDPLGMVNASAGYQAFANHDNKALPHSRKTTLPLNNKYYITNPAAGINASITDMGRFLLAVSSDGYGTLPAGIADTVLSPQVLSPLRRVYLKKWNGVESKHYGLGWRIIGYKGYMIGYHGGYVQGFRAEIAVCREEELGIAFLTNSPGRVGSSAVPMLLDLYFY